MLIRSSLIAVTMCLIGAGGVMAEVQVTTGISPDRSYFQVPTIPCLR